MRWDYIPAKLTRELAISELKDGATLDQIREKYRGWKEMPLAQWKAHVTMGTYDETEVSGAEELQAAVAADDLLSKQDALDLLVAGIPAEEIHSCYPTSFSIGQLRAFKAHVTMGTYEK